MAEKNIIVPDIQVHYPQESQQSQLKKITNKETTVDPIRYRDETGPLRLRIYSPGYLVHVMTYRAKHSYEI